MILNNLPRDKHIIDIVQNGKGNISLKLFNGYIHNGKKQMPQYPIFICRMTHLNFSLGKLGNTFKLQKEFLKTELNHDENDENKWRDKKIRMVRLC